MTETLWAGDFGDAYTERNRDAGHGRGEFWRELVAKYEITSALEVGCNAGANLLHLSEMIKVAGVDVNQGALDLIPQRIPTWRVSASDLPFPNRSFDLAFTIGVLIHIPLVKLNLAMGEIVRCSDRYVLCGEYHAEVEETVPYRGQERALWRRPYGELYQEQFGLALVDSGLLTGGTWDDIDWALLERA